MKVGNWAMAVANSRFRNKLIAGVVLLVAILLFFPIFFAVIESRKGLVMNDWLLSNIGPHDFSVPVFIIIWSMTLMFFIRSYNQPQLFLTVVWCVVLLSLVRMTTIYLVALDPPAGLIKLQDPLTSLTYGGRNIFITKDLFFSGHTSNMLVLAFCFEKRSDKWLAFIGAIAVGIMVLFQHVHYSIDVIAAFIITFLLVKVGKKLAAY